ncbi:MAG: hypothetical protein L3J82_02130 [Planctomycetes bacterium]|nr:hypothetical protein [Planctomycetota bacterium]
MHGKFKLGGDWLGQGNSSGLATSGGTESLKVAVEVSPEKPATPPDDANHPDATWLLRFSSSRQQKSTVTHIQMAVHRRVDGRWTLVGNTQLPAAERGGRDLQTLRLYFPIGEIVSGVTDFSEVATILSVSARLDPQSKLLKRYRKRVRKQLDEPVVMYHWTPQRVAMTLPDDPNMLTRFQSFRRQAIFGHPQRELKSGQKYAATCSPCHAEITEYYMKHDHHVRAMDTLRGLNNGSDKDPACTTCHTTPRLITAKDKTKSYDLHEGVLCASCHTDADSHARRPNLVRPLTVQRSLCEACHNSVQSPNYRHEAYWKKLGCVKFKKNR